MAEKPKMAEMATVAQNPIRILSSCKAIYEFIVALLAPLLKKVDELPVFVNLAVQQMLIFRQNAHLARFCFLHVSLCQATKNMLN